MKFGSTLRRHWPETLLVVAVALPWVTLLVLGMLWLWQTGRVWIWAIVAAVLGLLAWPLLRLVRRRANAEARLALGDLSEPSRAWTARERDAWSEVLAIASKTDAFLVHRDRAACRQRAPDDRGRVAPLSSQRPHRMGEIHRARAVAPDRTRISRSAQRGAALDAGSAGHHAEPRVVVQAAI